jgi:L-ascorbate metabolism protein UlaG (beta-lactamase superfamily)
MRISKHGHACVRIEHEGHTVVIDPGVFTDPEAIDGATAVLLTHEHPDHTHADHLRRTDAPIWTVGGVADLLRADAPDVAERVATVAPGEQFDAGIPVRPVGEWHAVIHDDLPRVHNSGFLLTVGDTRIFHPGDALTGPGEPVDLMCLVVSAPWMKVGEAIDFARAVEAPRFLGIHDRVYSEAGLGIVDGHLGRLLGEEKEFVRIADGAEL